MPYATSRGPLQLLQYKLANGSTTIEFVELMLNGNGNGGRGNGGRILTGRILTEVTHVLVNGQEIPARWALSAVPRAGFFVRPEVSLDDFNITVHYGP